MNTYDKVKAIVESGHIAICKNADGYILFSSMRNNGCIRGSSFGFSIKECYETLGKFDEIKRSIEELTYIGVYNSPVRYPKVGDKVGILESVKNVPERGEFNTDWEEMIGGPYEVKGNNYNGHCLIYNKSKSDYFCFDYRYIYPRVEEEKDDDISEQIIEMKKKIAVINEYYDEIIKKLKE